MKIEMTILLGNLFADDPASMGIDIAASGARYRDLVEAAIRADYPDADVDIRVHTGSGADVLTRVEFGAADIEGGKDVDGDTADAIAESVDSIASRVFEHGDWIVDLVVV